MRKLCGDENISKSSMSDFKFEYRAGDKVWFKKAKWLVTGRTRMVHISIGDYNCHVIQCNLKPRGKKTKARYKAERLKWQQRSLKFGDWVEIIHDYTFGAPCKPPKKTKHKYKAGDWVRRTSGEGKADWKLQRGAEFQVISVSDDGNYICDYDGKQHGVEFVELCDPPKPAPIESENFKIVDHGCGDIFIVSRIDDKGIGRVHFIFGVPRMEAFELSSIYFFASDHLNEIATLLDRLDAGKK